MKNRGRNTQLKAKKLLRLYSQWQETRQDFFQKQCLKLLSEILSVNPGFRLRREFQSAF